MRLHMVFWYYFLIWILSLMFKVFISMVLQAWRLNRITGDNSLIGELDPLKNNGQVSLLSTNQQGREGLHTSGNFVKYNSYFKMIWFWYEVIIIISESYDSVYIIRIYINFCIILMLFHMLYSLARSDNALST